MLAYWAHASPPSVPYRNVQPKITLYWECEARWGTFSCLLVARRAEWRAIFVSGPWKKARTLSTKGLLQGILHYKVLAKICVAALRLNVSIYNLLAYYLTNTYPNMLFVAGWGHFLSDKLLHYSPQFSFWDTFGATLENRAAESHFKLNQWSTVEGSFSLAPFISFSLTEYFTPR